MKKGEDYTGISIVFFCHDGRGSFVMNRRSQNARDEHGKWDIGGGGLKYGEDVEECLHREIREEYCSDVIKHEFLGYRNIHRTNEGARTHWIALDFIVQVNRTQVVIGEPHKMEALEWFNLKTMPPLRDRHSQSPKFWNKNKGHIERALNQFEIASQSTA